MTVKIRTSQITRFVIRASFAEDKFWVDAMVGRRENILVGEFDTKDAAQVFIEELSKAL